ncbi:AraC family transcriptional regulator [Paraburkholderia tropica]|nr:helix-turn-helix transcriptional regulator [Paraburkholderia tropica]
MPSHDHPRGRLIHSIEGTIDVLCDGKIWVLPPYRALWIPSQIRHELSTRSPARMRSLDIGPPLVDRLPALPLAINVGAMLQALIYRAVELGAGYREDQHALALLSAIPEEVNRSPRERIALSFPTDRRIARICRSLLDAEGLKRSLQSWAEEVGASTRTLERLFTAETGLTFIEWRQAALMQIAVTKLASRKSIRDVCDELGVQSTSAFHRGFRKHFGMPPGEYLQAR